MASRLVWTRSAWAAAGAVVLGAASLAAARAGNVLNLAPAQPPEPAVYRSSNTPAQDRLLAKAAFTEVLAKKTDTLGMKPPATLPSYAPVFPDGLILDETLSPDSPTGGSLQYEAAGSLRTVLDFYEDAAALHHLPFRVAAAAPGALVFTAADGPQRVEAKLTHEFANGTQVDLSYD